MSVCCICSVSPSCHLVSRPPPPAGRNLHISPVSPAPDFPNSIFTFVTVCKWYSVRQYLAALSILPISSEAFPYYFCQVAGAGYSGGCITRWKSSGGGGSQDDACLKSIMHVLMFCLRISSSILWQMINFQPCCSSWFYRQKTGQIWGHLSENSPSPTTFGVLKNPII